MASNPQASRPGSSKSASSASCHRAFVSVTSTKDRPLFRPAWLSILYCVRWKYIESKDEAPPDTLSAFSSANRFELEKVASHATWIDVEHAVPSLDTNHGPGLTVRGKLFRRRISTSSPKTVTLTIVAENEGVRDLWSGLLRMRVAPWELLSRRVTDLLNSGLRIEEVQKMLGCVEESKMAPRVASGSDAPESTSIGGSFVMDGINIWSSFIETVAVFVQTSAPAIKETAEAVGNIAKCVTIVGSAFQVVTLCITLLDMATEANRSYGALPRILAKVVELHAALVNSMVPVLHPEGRVDVISLKRMFKVQEDVSCVMYDIEMRMLHGIVRRFLKSGDLRKIEAAVDKLSENVESVVLSGRIAGIAVEVAEQGNTLAQHDAEIQQLKGKVVRKQVLGKCDRPRLTPYFSGREKELSELKQKLDEYGSAAIMQFGGSGKTQLMTAFADRAEKNGWVPGGCFWLQANGSMAQFLPVLVNFAEALTSLELSQVDRGNKRKVIAVIRKELQTYNESWLLCVDNADDREVNSTVGDLCYLANIGTGKGRVLVTSRQGAYSMWDGMVADQKLKLQPLAKEHAMEVLVRWQLTCLSDVVGYQEIRDKIDEMHVRNPAEYNALLELAGSEKKHGLGGLPLGLGQAGSYINRYQCSFLEYSHLYKEARKQGNLERLFRDVEDNGQVNEGQRSIWTTWKINVLGLSDNARDLLYSFALLDATPVPEKLLKRLAADYGCDGWLYTEIVEEELMHTGSLVEKDYDKSGCTVFKMHPRIREFVVNGAKEEENTFRDALIRVICSLHCHICELFSDVGRCMDDDRYWPREKLEMLLPHASSVVDHFHESSISFLVLSCTDELVQLHSFLIRYSNTSEVASLAAVKLYRTLLAAYGSDSDHIYRASILHDIGLLRSRRSRLIEAEDFFSRSLSMKKRLFGETADHFSISSTIYGLARVSERRERLEEAEQRFRESIAMKLREKGRSRDTPDVVLAFDGLRDVVMRKGKLDEAESLNQQSTSLKKRLYDKEQFYREASEYLDRLANEFFKGNLLVKAEKCYRERFKMDSFISGDRHTNSKTAQDVLKLACAYFDLNDLVISQKLFREALDLIALLPDAAKINIEETRLLLYLFYPVFYYHYHDCLYLHQKFDSDTLDHLGVAWILNELGSKLFRTHPGHYYASRCFLLKSLKMKRRFLSKEDNSSISRTLYHLAELTMKEGNPVLAEKLYLDSLGMDRRLYGHNTSHKDVYYTLQGLACAVLENGMICEAESLIRESCSLVVESDDKQTSRGLSMLWFKSAWKVLDLGSPPDAVRFFRESLSSIRLMHESKKHVDVAVVLQGLSCALFEAKNITEAESCFRECLDIFKSTVYGTKSIQKYLSSMTDVFKSNLNSYSNGLYRFVRRCSKLHQKMYGGDIRHVGFARILVDLGQDGESCVRAHLYRQSLTIMRQQEGTKELHAPISLILFRLACVLDSRGEFEDSELLYRESLKIDLRLHGDDADHEDIALTRQKLGEICLASNRLSEAEEFYQKSYEMQYNLHGETSGAREETMALYRLGRKASKMKLFEDAERFYRCCLISVRRVHVIGFHGDISIVLYRLSELLFHLGKIHEAEELFRESMENIGTDSMKIHTNLFNFALVKKERFYHDCVDLHSKLFTNSWDHFGFASILYQLGCLSEDDDVDKWFEQSVAMQRRLLDPDEPSTSLALTLFSMADSAKKTGKLDDAKNLYEQSLHVERKLHGVDSDHRNVVKILYNLAEVALLKCDLDESERFHRASFEMKFRVDGFFEGSEHKLKGLYRLAIKAVEQGMFVTAKRIFDECLEIVHRLHGGIECHMDIAVIMQGLASAQMGLNETVEAKSLFRDCLHMMDTVLCDRMASEFRSYSTYLRFAFNDDYQFYRSCVKLRQELFANQFDSMSFVCVLLRVAGMEMNRAAYANASELFRDGLQMIFRLNSSQNNESHVASEMRHWGQSLVLCVKLDDAKKPLQESLDIFRRLHQDHHEDIAKGLYWQARLSEAKREFDKADRLYKECLDMCKSQTKFLYPTTSQVLEGQAWIAFEQNKIEDTERLCRECLKFSEGKSYSRVGLLARVALKRGSFEEGLKLCEESLEKAKCNLGADAKRPSIARVMVTAAQIKFRQGHVEEAVEDIERAIEMYRWMFKDIRHPRVIEAEGLLSKWKVGTELPH